MLPRYSLVLQFAPLAAIIPRILCENLWEVIDSGMSGRTHELGLA